MVDKGNVLTIGVCYKSPNAEDSEVNELMNIIKKVSNNMVLIMGDFNFPGMDWVTLKADATGSKFLDLTQDCYLTQHVLKPTRYDNILDVVLSSEENMVEELFVLEHLANLATIILLHGKQLVKQLLIKMIKSLLIFTRLIMTK